MPSNREKLSLRPLAIESSLRTKRAPGKTDPRHAKIAQSEWPTSWELEQQREVSYVSYPSQSLACAPTIKLPVQVYRIIGWRAWRASLSICRLRTACPSGRVLTRRYALHLSCRHRHVSDDISRPELNWSIEVNITPSSRRDIPSIAVRRPQSTGIALTNLSNQLFVLF
ncbi:hypothetical protein H2248_007767 [Termitomyces sp. 'cryptogamus']|nr:hypothetical protein H2248_007767 [Termitomyces sp. 'cryptogamus']